MQTFSSTYSQIADLSLVLSFLSTHADRQGVDISFTVCLLFFVILCVCTVTDFTAVNKGSGVKFCTVVYRRPGHILGNFCPRSPKSDDGISLPRTPMNHRPKFDAASFILGGEIHNRKNTQKVPNISTLWL